MKLRRGPAPCTALVLRGDQAEESKTVLQQVLEALFPSRDERRSDFDDEVPAEYLIDSSPSHSSAWVHSHIATRLATAGDDEAH